MGLTYRGQKGSALTIQELDGNFQYFTGSHAITGSLTVSSSLVCQDSVQVTGSLTVSGSLTTFNFVSGAVITPTASLSGIAPTFSATEGQFLFGSGSEGYKMFVWLGGQWRSGSLD